MSKKSRPKPFQLRGTLLAYNISPKGHIEGALIETDDGLAQLNFPKHAADEMAQALALGSKVDLTAELEHDDGDHPVYEPCEEAEQARGTVVRLNYALHGEVNGYHLDDGTFVHVKPDGAKRYKLRIGSTIAATGSRRRGTDAVVLEAEAVKRADPSPSRAAPR